MTDLRARFDTLDALHAPDMWREIEVRAQAKERRVTRTISRLLIGVAALLALLVGAAFLVGSGAVKLSSTPPNSAPSTHTAVPSLSPSTAPPSVHPAAWMATGNMLEAREGHTATLLADGRVLVAGGYSGSTILTTAEIYDPERRSWTATGKMLYPHTDHTATLLPDGKVLIVGGNSTITQHAELYDPSAGTWRAVANLTRGLRSISQMAILLADGSVLVAGYDLPLLFNPTAGTWRDTNSMVERRFAYAATILADGTVLAAGGRCCTDDFSLASAEVYDPDQRLWSVAGSMSEPRSDGTATLLADGTVLVAGGSAFTKSGLQPLPAAELYDPIEATWTPTSNMEVARGTRGTFTLLQDGSVLAVGGIGAPAGTELYDPVAGTWIATASMLAGRGDHTATRLADGMVLVVGGWMNVDAAGNGIPMTSAELYDPAAEN